MWSIYKHTCKATGKSYIGQTIGTIDSRAKFNGSGYRKSPKFYAAIQKYGWDNFTHEILETNIDSEAKANEREQYWISYYDTLKNGYNILPGGQINNSDLFRKIYQIDKDKNIINKFKSAADATRKLFPEKPYWYANEILKCCRNIRSNADGLYFCFVDEYDQYQPQKVKNSFNTILQLDKDKNIINKFNTFTEASKATGISIPHIWACCNGKRKTAGNYYWCFELDYNKYLIPEVDNWPESKAVVQVDKKTNKIIKWFPSANIASKETGISRGNISSACRGEIPSAGGYIWKFNEDCLKNKEIKKPMEKESVKMFDLQAAFKALDEIEAPKTKGLKSTRVNLKERFSAKDATTALVEDYYSVTTHEALEEAQEDRESEIAKAKLARIEKIVDLDAETEDDLLPSYVGKVIIQCPQCMTLFYKKPEDIEHSEENPDVVNINEVCQHCGNTSGYTVIGKVDSVKEEEASSFDTEEAENELDLDFPEATEETSPEGTGGGFEDELELEIEDSGSEDELDLNLEEVELEPTEESLKITEAKEDSDSGDTDEAEVTVTLGEIKDVAEDAGKAIVNAEVEETEDVKEVTDKVVEKEVEVKETLTEGCEHCEEEKKVCPECGKEICECDGKKLAENEECKNGECEKPLEECGEKLTEAPQTPDEIERILMDVAASFDESLKEDKVSNSEFHNMINSEVWKDFGEDLKEDIETVKAKLPEYCDALEHAGEDVAKEIEAEKAAEVEVKAEEPKEEPTPVEEPVVEESLTEAKVGTIPSNLPWWIHIMDDEVEEDYSGTPEIRTTHLEYEDKDPTDGKAVLPDNLGEELEEHVQDRPAPVEDETVIQGGDNAVVDCQTEHKIIAHSEDEKPLDCNMKKEPLEEPVAGEKVDIKINEEIEDFNEQFFDKAVNEYLKEVYENVNEYKTSGCELKEGKLFVEGTILFNSGRAKKTIFEFLPVKEELGSLILEGYNKDLTEEKAFTVKGALEGGNQFITESFGYKYTINETLVEGLK